MSNKLPRGTQDYFLLNSVVMTNDHIINQLPKAELNDTLNKLFMRGLLGQYKLKEDIVGGTEESDFEMNFY